MGHGVQIILDLKWLTNIKAFLIKIFTIHEFRTGRHLCTPRCFCHGALYHRVTAWVPENDIKSNYTATLPWGTAWQSNYLQVLSRFFKLKHPCDDSVIEHTAGQKNICVYFSSNSTFHVCAIFLTLVLSNGHFTCTHHNCTSYDLQHCYCIDTMQK